jgi:cell division protein FtsW
MWKTATILIGIVLILVTLGIVALASSSPARAQANAFDGRNFTVLQIVWLVAALIAGFIASRLDYHHYRWLCIPVALFSAALLVLVIVPGVGLCINGSRRWLPLGPVRIQPSEFAKFALIVTLAAWMKFAQRKADTFVMGLLIPGAYLGFTAGLVFIEPDFGTTALLSFVGFAILFLGGTRLPYLVVSAALGLAGFAVAVAMDPVRMRRILSFLHPERYAEDEAFQLINALYAFIAGGLRGAGLGQGLQKRFYLPEAHTDFIFAIIGEEMGFIFTAGIVLLYLGFLFCGMFIAWRAPDRFGRLLAFGITLMIATQAAINIGVVTGCLPTKGLALPFISYGGSSLLVCSFMVGVLVNVALHAGGAIEDDDTRIIKDRTVRL